MTVIKAAAVQLSPVLYSREGTVNKVCRQILALGREGVQFATFPETVVPYYPYFSFVQPPSRMSAEHHRLLEQAVTVPSAATRAIGEACKQAGMVVSVGVNERDGGTLYNAQLLFDADGGLLQHRRSRFPLDRRAEEVNGFARPLQPPGSAQPADRPHAESPRA